MPLRPATEADLDTIIELIHALAEYEHEPAAVRLEPERLRLHLFGVRPFAEVLLAETPAGESAGFALFFHNFSTWEGRPGIWLEDLFVRPQFRGQGMAKRCSWNWPALPANAAAPGSNGPSSIGTSLRSPSTVPWAPSPWTNGRPSASPATPSRR